MKTVILCGGFGTRISGEEPDTPKALVKVGGMPIIWHVMKGYSAFGYNEFILCAGYLQEKIKQWFNDYYLNSSDVTFDLETGTYKILRHHGEPWKVTVIDTGYDTMTGGRLGRIRDHVGSEDFLMTYCDGVGDIDIPKTVEFHKERGKLVTVSVYDYEQSKGIIRFGENGAITSFEEKINKEPNYINIGYMVMSPGIFDYIDSDSQSLEKDVFPKVVEDGQMSGVIHHGFWQCMDTAKERDYLNSLWNGGSAPWVRK